MEATQDRKDQPTQSKNQIQAQLDEAAEEDPIVRFFVDNWRQLLLAAAVAGLIWLSWRTFESTRLADLDQAAGVYESVRSQHQQILSTEQQLASERAKQVKTQGASEQAGEAAQDEVDTRIAELTKALESGNQAMLGTLGALSGSRGPYSKVAVLYRTLASVRAGDVDALDANVGIPDWTTVDAEAGEDRFFAELLALIKARAWLDSDLERGRSALLGLVNQGVYVNVSAAQSLAGVAETAEQRSNALSALQALTRRAPEQAELLSDELERLKANQ